MSTPLKATRKVLQIPVNTERAQGGVRQRPDQLRLYQIQIHRYQDVVSLNAFFYSGRRRNFDPHRSLLYDIPSIEGGILKQSVQGPVIEFDSIYAFYEYIGYDYRRKRYLRG